MILQIVVGDLRAYGQLEKGTFQHVDQLLTERRVNPITEADGNLRNKFLYTADGHGYFPRKDGGVDWAITREAENLVLRHLDDHVNSSYDQLTKTHNYHPDNAEAQVAKDAESTVVIDMSKLRLTGDHKVIRSLWIRTEDGLIQTEDGYQELNEEEQKVITRLGYTSEDFKILHDHYPTLKDTEIYVLNPDYIKEKVEKSQSDSLWRASGLHGFGGNSGFDAFIDEIDFRAPLRGVRASTASPKAPEGRNAP